MKKHNERSKVTITATPSTTDGSAFTPTTARYRVDDFDTGTSMVGWTTLTPSTSMTFSISGPTNKILSRNKREEIKVVTIQTDLGLDSEHNEEYFYALKNLQFIQ